LVKYGVLLALFALTFLLPGASKGWESVSMWWYLPMLAAALFLGVWIGKRRRDAREREQRRQEMENRPRDYAAGAVFLLLYLVLVVLVGVTVMLGELALGRRSGKSRKK